MFILFSVVLKQLAWLRNKSKGRIETQLILRDIGVNLRKYENRALKCMAIKSCKG